MAAHDIPPEPVFILTPPCTFSWVISAMLGQHPDMYALPELHLFRAETMAGWQQLCRAESFEMDHGLVRTVAELYYGEQTENTVLKARGWLERRGHCTTGFLLEQIIHRAAPRVILERSPSHVYSQTILGRIREMFPNAMFVHLTGHPRAYGETVMNALARRGGPEAAPVPDWLAHLARFPHETPGELTNLPDPQWAWLALHRNIVAFLDTVPTDHQRRIKAEHVLAGDQQCLESFANWLGVRTDLWAIETMQHPQASPFAHPGPPSAALGSDIFMFGGTDYPPEWRSPRTLEGAADWLPDGAELVPAVKELARAFGYS